ncbi:MAG: SAM-dependent methyltransferase [Streptosporangiaceae bacterium]
MALLYVSGRYPFIGRVARHVATEGGIRQFLDLGGGLPTQTNVHEMAQQVVPDACVVYVDIDPVVWSHGQARWRTATRSPWCARTCASPPR